MEMGYYPKQEKSETRFDQIKQDSAVSGHVANVFEVQKGITKRSLLRIWKHNIVSNYTYIAFSGPV